jgi:cyclohexanecarboxylate-CoA ligase
MISESVLNSRRENMKFSSFWIDKTMEDFMALALASSPNKEALIAYRHDQTGSQRFTYFELSKKINLAAQSLHGMGVRQGDVVSVQLPNWWEFVVITLACGRIGAVMNPLMHIFRERELTYMLGFAKSKVLFIPKKYRDFDFEKMVEGMRQDLPDLVHVVVVDGSGPHSFENFLQADVLDAGVTIPKGASPLKPDDLAVLMFTSGTTGSPKGVMHTSNTLVSCMNALSHRFGVGDQDVYLASTPVGHMTGYVAVVLIGLQNAGKVVLQDFWDPLQCVAIMVNEQVSYFAASTPFLNDICEVVEAQNSRLPILRSFLCGGAPIPPVLIDRARDRVGIRVCSLWGMTEILSGTLTEPARSIDKSSSSDGRVLEGMDILIVDDSGVAVPQGQTGRLWVRGAQVFLGYYRQPDIQAFNAQGWFDSGDLAYMDAEGYIRIAGRSKDVLIRGGENVPVVEIEGLLLKHPAIEGVSIVGYPDFRLGERACAFVVLRDCDTFTLKELQEYMAASKVAKQYWPEKVEVVDQLPMTPSGKIQKYKLKEIAKKFSA